MEKSKRLLSLDLLRGFDLFMLVVFCPILLELKIDADWYRAVTYQFTHAHWVGFRAWDMVMPLFMFLSGVTIPFALAKYRRGEAPKSELYKRIIKRVALLWVLGMVVQGNLLSLNPLYFKAFSNTLQAIAVGYFFSALAFVYLPKRWCYISAAGLLVGYWAVFTFVGGGDYGELTNIANRIDISVLGGARDGASIDPATGVVNHSAHYLYTWVLSSMNFVVTVLSGMLAGWFLRGEQFSGVQKSARIAAAGVVCVAAGWLWSLDMPVIKPIWTSSMTLISSGISLLLLAAFYYAIDVRGRSKGLTWLRLFGMNSIVAYVLSHTPWCKALAASVLGGLEQYTADYFRLVVELGSVAIIWGVLYILYKNNKILRV